MEDKHIERIEEYFNKKLNELQSKQFLDDLEQDPELKQLFSEYELALNVIDNQAEKDLREKISQWRTEWKHRQTRSLFIYSGIAASILLLLGIYLFFLQNRQPVSVQQLALEYYTLPETPESTMGGGKQHWSLGIDAFSKKQYKQAIKEWELIEEKTPEVYYYLAHCYFNTREFNNSIVLFQELSTGTSVYSYASDWFLALAYLSSDNIGESMKILNAILENHNHPYYNNAQKLKAKLKT